MNGITILNIFEGVLYLSIAVMVGAGIHTGDFLYYLLAAILTVTAIPFSLVQYITRRDPEAFTETQRHYSDCGPQPPLM